MAWMTREEPRAFSRMPNEPDMETLTYWVTRLEPLIRAETEEEIIVVFCNRSGTEGDATYAGTSAVLGILQGEVRVYGLLGRGQKELLVVDTSDPPFGKLIYRPDEEQETEASTHEVQQPSSGETGLAIPGQNCDSSLAALEVPATSDKDGEPTTNEPAQAQEFSMTPGVDRSPESYLKMDATARDNVSDIFTPPPPTFQCKRLCAVARGKGKQIWFLLHLLWLRYSLEVFPKTTRNRHSGLLCPRRTRNKTVPDQMMLLQQRRMPRLKTAQWRPSMYLLRSRPLCIDPPQQRGRSTSPLHPCPAQLIRLFDPS